MTQPAISVIIPVFNAKRTLANALHSVWEQTFPAHEVLVIDGGSTDGTIEIILANQSRISHWISEPDRGVYDAINKGLRKATGDWIYVLGSDDVLASNDVFEGISEHLNTSASLVFGSVQNVNIRQSMVPEMHMSSMGPLLYLKNTLHQQSAFYRKTLFTDEAFDASMRVLADYDFHLQLYKHKTPFKKLDVVVAACDASGLSKQFKWSLYREEFKLKRKRLGTLSALFLSPIIGLKFLLKQLR
jgi:glycosyltransferase involved in cell wall biosynthesis